MFNLDPTKLLIIAVVAVILLGPDKLPQVARQAGAAWRTFNEFRHRMETEVRSSIPDLPSSADIARMARSPSALLNHLSTLSTDEAEANGNGADRPASGERGPGHGAVGLEGWREWRLRRRWRAGEPDRTGPRPTENAERRSCANVTSDHGPWSTGLWRTGLWRTRPRKMGRRARLT